jgi:hypothetical protein
MGYIVLFCVLANQNGSAYAFAVTMTTLVIDVTTNTLLSIKRARKERKRLLGLHPPVQLSYGESRTLVRLHQLQQ